MIRLLRFARTLAACVALLPIGAFAQNGAPHDIIANIPATHVRILGALFAESGMTYYECVAFANDGDLAITSATFKLIYFDANKHDAGTQDVTVRATVAPHGRIVPPGFGQGDDPTTMANCTPLTAPHQLIDPTFISPEHVEYADGTVWDLKKRSASPSPNPTPTGTSTP